MNNKIKIIGNEKNKDRAMESLLNQTTKFYCLDDEVYLISDEALLQLTKDKVKFKIINSEQEKEQK